MENVFMLLLLMALRCNAAAVAATSHGGLGFQCPRAILAFGESHTDTGENIQAFTGLANLGVAAAERLPYGITYFGRPVDRYSDGRLVIDFFCQAFGLRLLDPYFENIAPDFRHGINFAAGGTTVRPEDLGGIPFHLGLQVNQAVRFYKRSLSRPPRALVPEPASFGNRGLYFIFGAENDILYAILANSTVDRIRSIILPEIVSNVSLAITRLYNSTGARQFLIFGVVPVGCTSTALGNGWQDLNPAYGPLDQVGCAQGIDEFIKEYNKLLQVELRFMRTQLPKATIIYADPFSIIYDVVANPSRYGFREGIEACCGAGGPPYNYNATLGTCGSEAATVCSDPSKFVIWDGIHYTEALYKVVATAILQGKFVEPTGFNFSSLCNLDFSKFNDKKEKGQ